MIISGYVMVVLLTSITSAEMVGLAYDSGGGVTTSTITVPLELH